MSIPKRIIDAAVRRAVDDRYEISRKAPDGSEPVLSCWVSIDPDGLVAVRDAEPIAGEHGFKSTGHYCCIHLNRADEKEMAELSDDWRDNKAPLGQHILTYLVEWAVKLGAHVGAVQR